MTKKRDIGLLHRFAYPPYRMEAVGQDEVLVCGGGGASKTGVPNQLEIVRLEAGQGPLPAVRSLGRTSTGTEAVMSAGILGAGPVAVVMAAEGSVCQEYQVDANRKFTKGRSVRCPAGINTVRVSPDGAGVALGLSDGSVRLHRLSDFGLIAEFRAHASEVACLDASPGFRRVATAGGGTNEPVARLWRQDGSKVTELAPPARLTGQVAFRHCLLGRPESVGANEAAFASLLPTGRARGKAPCHLAVWDLSAGYRLRACVSTGPELTSALRLSDEGRFLGLATLDGTVSVYAAFSLQRLYRLPQAHSVFLTDLVFMPPLRALRAGNDWELLSVSADCLMRWHRCPTRPTYSCFWPLIGAAIIVFLFFYALSELGL
ncbi:hypothetical protein BOX15_Mlig003270g1 [Macrostomum lignano]|uniref:WD_REPEATS_REGION domain-containing protein n=1 Tax=Macrostomum lignano TaxID=282301 RepID=A0A267DTC3_9PLAT|nr:hypothetical protein BOX15_Mlig003270g1 [Macrostomum lignano]